MGRPVLLRSSISMFYTFRQALEFGLIPLGWCTLDGGTGWTPRVSPFLGMQA